ncbi:MAG TPA: TetR/AcrR family transcriptional regulator [Acidimicrobiales bacterium]|nr:TetR/AcrR family transcriptional regulator [Acidimicrobiales bacterium]
MPKLWDKTIEAHRREVRDAILDTTASLATEHGPLSVTMSQIAEETGVGRATLYKYFPDVESILLAWHERQVTDHLGQLAELGHQGGDAGQRLQAVLERYALIRHQYHGAELAAFVHHGDHFTRAHDHLTGFVRDLLREAAEAGDVRADVSADELASYCLHAITAASSLPSKASVRRLVQVILTGLRSHPTIVDSAVPPRRRGQAS